METQPAPTPIPDIDESDTVHLECIYRNPEGWVRIEYEVPVEVLKRLRRYEAKRHPPIHRTYVAERVAQAVNKLPQEAREDW